MTFGEVLEVHMKKTGLTQADIAKMTGLTRAAVCQLVAGKRDPLFSTALKIIRRTQMPFKYIMQIDERVTDSHRNSQRKGKN